MSVIIKDWHELRKLANEGICEACGGTKCHPFEDQRKLIHIKFQGSSFYYCKEALEHLKANGAIFEFLDEGRNIDDIKKDIGIQ